jgi:hypothetical protein
MAVVFDGADGLQSPSRMLLITQAFNRVKPRQPSGPGVNCRPFFLLAWGFSLAITHDLGGELHFPVQSIF